MRHVLYLLQAPEQPAHLAHRSIGEGSATTQVQVVQLRAARGEEADGLGSHTCAINVQGTQPCTRECNGKHRGL